MKTIIFSILILSSASVLAETKVTFNSNIECLSVLNEIKSNYKGRFGTYSGKGKVIRIGCFDPSDTSVSGGGFLIVRTVQEEEDLQIKIQKEIQEDRLKRQQRAQGFMKGIGL